jgi:signal transduction histidine kinase
VLAERALADSERRRREILITMLQAEENERSRIATELHDDTVQVMTAALLSMDRVALVARKAGDMKLESAVMHTRATLEEATDRTRRLMFELRPAILHENGLRAALRVLADQTARATNATARVRCEPARYDPSIEELVYRTIQEALANIRKHAAAERISVTVAEDAGALRGVIRDDGRGFDVAAARIRPDAAFHLGIAALVERVHAAGGTRASRRGWGRARGCGSRFRWAAPSELEASACVTRTRGTAVNVDRGPWANLRRHSENVMPSSSTARAATAAWS